jgi:DNA-binding MarR family transcriptional regulator
MATIQHDQTTEPAAAGLDRTAVAAQMIAQLRGALGELRCVGSERLVRRGISMSHLHLMSMLDRHGELPMSRLADVLDISLSNATGVVDRLAERGLVERAGVPDDRRIVIVRVTDEGRRALAELELFRDEVVARILDRLDDEQLTRLVASVDDLHGAIQSAVTDEPGLFAHGQPADLPYPDVRATGSPSHR